MSWPQWQPPAQPTIPMMNAAMPMGIQYTAEQWQQMQQQNWQQWAQWQQQYQQWHQQYGAEYQKSLSAMANMTPVIPTAPTINTNVPPPLPNEAKPPPPPEEPVQSTQHQLYKPPPGQPQTQKPVPPTQNTQVNQPPNQSNQNSKSAFGYNSFNDNSNWNNQHSAQNSGNNVRKKPNDFHNNELQRQRTPLGKRPALEHNGDLGSSKKNRLDWQAPPSAQATQFSQSQHSQPQTQQNPESTEDLSDPEKKFMKQFAEWEAQFNKWKEQNQDHPDKAQYREYEKKWEAWRNQLLERREQMKKKRLGLIPPNISINNSIDLKSTTAKVNSTSLPPTSSLSTLQKSSSDLCASYVGSLLSTADNSDSIINPINSKALETLFKNNLNDGIPGLDLVDAPEQPDDIPDDDKNKQQVNNTESAVKPTLNLEALSKNLNSILGDQKLLSMLNLVAQGAKPVTDSNVNVPSTQTPTIPCGITLAPPKVIVDDQASNWSNNSGNSTQWSQDFNANSNSNVGSFHGRGDFNLGSGPCKDQSSDRFSGESYEQNPRGYSVNERSFDDYGDKGEARDESGRFEDNYWSPEPSEQQFGSRCQDPNFENAPAPPTITSFDQLLQIDKIVDYEHKSKNKDTADVRVFTSRLFDYRHKLVNRIPLPERPKWLTDSFHNIPEFHPPIGRNPLYSRQVERYSVGAPPPPSNLYNDNNPFSRRLPAYNENLRRPDEFRNHAAVTSGKDSFETQNWRNPRDTERDPDSMNNRDFDKSRQRDKNFDFNKNKDVRSPSAIPGETTTNKKEVFDTSGPFRNLSNSFSANQQLFSAALRLGERRLGGGLRTNVDEILLMPGRAKRPQRLVIIMRGPPGSGKTFLAKQIKDKETENGGSAPRILSLDDYFMVEQEKDVVEDGKTIKVKEMVYEYEECMEESYRQSLLKTFKKTITDGYFSFIIVDNVNDKVKYFDQMWSFAKLKGFQVYICQLDLDVQQCTKRNTHGRSEIEIQQIVNGWELTPNHYGVLDVTTLIQAGAIPEVEMEEINSPNDDFDDDEENEEQACNSSKWDNFECSIDNLAKLDGINKPLRSSGTMEDYLQLDEWTTHRGEAKPGQKRVRWADLEEYKQQEKMRAIGFVVGQTDWGRMMDPTQGSSALTQTKYIERVGVRKVNSN